MGKEMIIACLTILLIVAPVAVYFWLADLRDAREVEESAAGRRPDLS